MVALNFSSGAKVEERAGDVSERVFDDTNPTTPVDLLEEPPCITSVPLSIAQDTLAGWLGGPWMVGTRDIRTLFFRRCPWRAPGLPFKADGFPVGEIEV